ncbi:MAG: ABC transporter permease [Anaerolineae bacterium]|nr:MAG: ABC transporter permease [Anaerolineae bacterium]
MLIFVLRRLFFFLVTLAFTSILIFLLTRVLPGDVARIKAGRDAPPEAVEQVRQDLGLDKPLPVQYLNWVTNLVRGDWGDSFTTNTPIYPDVRQRLENSGRLAILTLLIAIPISLMLGIIAALNEGNLVDGFISILTLGVVSLPEFVTGIFLIHTVAFKWAKNWEWLPFELRGSASGFKPEMSFTESLPYLILPAIAATFVLLAYVTRLTRAGVIEELKRDYVRTAELKGLPYPIVIVRHVLRNALSPTVTVIAISLGWLISGLVVVESVFNYKGLGSLLIFAVENRDLPIIQAIVMITVAVILLANFLADLTYAFLNPRVRLGR